MLGAQLGKPGGEGTVYEVVGSPDRAAKRYHKYVPDAQAEKLRWMVRLTRSELLKFTAWPTATLHERVSGPVVGFLMPKAAGCKDIHTLYSPAQRRQDFPHADWARLVHTAVNCAAAFDTIHRAGYVIGDVNQKNVLVSANTLVYLIDCDSFQVRAGGRLFPCEVGFPEFTPPELQGGKLRDVERTPNHDRFGLAVLVFYLLFMGRHPFMGRYLGRGDMPLERAIREYRFAYSRAAAQVQMAPPPLALPLTVTSPDLVRLFERAFSQFSHQPTARPTAAEWGQALAQFERQLVGCSNDGGHKRPAHLSECPWCQLMQAGGPNYFITVGIYTAQTAAGAGAFVLAVVWQHIEQVPTPVHAYRRPSVPGRVGLAPAPLPRGLPQRPPQYTPVLLPERVRVPRAFLQQTVGCVAVAAVVLFVPGCLSASVALVLMSSLVGLAFGGWWAILEYARRIDQRRANTGWEEAYSTAKQEKARHKAAVAHWQRAVQQERERRWQAVERWRGELHQGERRWQAEADRYRTDFVDAKASLARLKGEYETLQKKHADALADLQRNVRAAQLRQFLEGRLIDSAEIPDIGPVRKAALRSYNIETALDVDAGNIAQVPGFGPKLTPRLLAWRADVERAFRFDPTAGVPRPLLDALNAQFNQQRQALEARLRQGPATLKGQAAKAENHLAQLLTGIQRLVVQVAQAEADASLLAG
jgi:DNA-binding helix-hairpin-helix protein with protein kinase domain